MIQTKLKYNFIRFIPSLRFLFFFFYFFFFFFFIFFFFFFYFVTSRKETNIISNSEKDDRFLLKTARSNRLVVFIISLDENDNKLSVCNKDDSTYLQ